jgi:MEMO1 family protein
MKSSLEFIDRHPAVAGQFYPSHPDKLKQQLEELFATAVPKQHPHVLAIISPHAGYIYSGKTAASAYSQIDAEATYKRVILIASSHHENFAGASVYCDGDYVMPYGKEHVDIAFGQMLVGQNPELFTDNPRPHIPEHSLEVQLPYLHHVLHTDYSIVPIILGNNNATVCKAIAEVLKPWLTPENLFIISSDFSHHPDYTDAKNLDADTRNAILTNNPDILRSTIRDHVQQHIPGLVTSLCGWTSVLTLMYMTADNENMEYHAIHYSNSGDSHLFGDTDRVVGYWAISVSEKQKPKVSEETESFTKKYTAENTWERTDFELSESDKKALLLLTRKTLEEKIRHGKEATFDTSGFSSNLKLNCGIFVSLHIKGRLRGCIGRLISGLPLYKMVQEMTVSAALHDPRFQPVVAEELEAIDIELSVLSPLHKISEVEEIQLGKHGIYLVKGRNSGVFLPQVAAETGWNREEFLGHCGRDKAGIGWNGWKMSEIYIFTTAVFGEKEGH